MKEVEIEHASDLYFHDTIGLLDSKYFGKFDDNHYDYILFLFLDTSSSCLVTNVSSASSALQGVIDSSLFESHSIAFLYDKVKYFDGRPDEEEITKELI